MGKRNLAKTVTFIILLLGAIISLIPFWWLIRSSLMDTAEIFEFPPKLWPEEVRWNNFSEALTTLPFGLYFRNTLFILIPVLVGVIVTSSICAYGFARLRFPLRSFWFALLIGSMMLPGAVTLIPTFLMWRYLNAINTFWPLVFPAWFGGGAFNIFLLRQFFLTIPRELDEAALIDGASYLRIFSQIMLPLIKPALIVVGLFTFLGVWNDFFGPLIYLNDESKFTLALGLQQFTGLYQSDWNLLMAASLVVLMPAIIVFFIGQNYFIEGIVMTGLKG